MRRILLLYILLSVVGLTSVYAQSYNNRRVIDERGYDQYGNQVDPSTIPDKLDSANVEIQGLPPKLYMWRIKNQLGDRTIIPIDTVSHHFQNSNLVEGITGHYNHLANLGSPRLSRIFFDRTRSESTIFMDPFSSFYVQPMDFNFTNSNVPYTNLTYHKAGNKVNGEERLKSYFSVNVNKRLAFGFNIDYLYGRGYYNSQNTAYFNAALFGSYMGDHYQAQAIYSNNYLKTNENGGITDDRYITAPEEMAEGKRKYESNNIPTVLSQTTNRNHSSYLFLTQRYNLGFHRDIAKAEEDTMPTKQEFVPVTSFIHTIHVERSRHAFKSSDNVADGYYPNTYFDPNNIAVKDTTNSIGIKNVVGIALLEGFNKYAKAGLTAFASHKISKYTLMNAEGGATPDKYNETEFYVGGEISKRKGKFLHYHAIGQTGVAGKATGLFSLKGDIDFNFQLGKDTLSFIARGEVSKELAPFYMRHYHSKHFLWDDDMDKIFRTRIQGEVNMPRWQTNIKAGIENIKKYTYFNQLATPEQHNGSIQVVSASLNQNFKLGALHLDNEVIWQKSSEQDVLPLPDLSLYHNLYLKFKLAKKVLSVELGADVRYFSEYYAPAYTPAIQNYHLQSDNDKIKIGAYPIVNVYANLHLKRTRIYVMMYHVNQGSGKSNYFMSPHYPINPRFLKLGLSWNFFD